MAGDRLRLIDDESDVRPLVERREIDAAVRQRRGEVASARLERVAADSHRPLLLVGLEELLC